MIKSVEMQIDKVLEVASKRVTTQNESEKFKGVMDKARKSRSDYEKKEVSTEVKDEEVKEKPEVQAKEDTEKASKIPEGKKEVKTEDSKVPEETNEEVLTDLKNIIEEILKLLKNLQGEKTGDSESKNELDLSKITELLKDLEMMVEKVPKEKVSVLKADILSVSELLGNSELKGEQFKSVLQNIEDRVNTILVQTEDKVVRNEELGDTLDQKENKSGEKDSKDMDTLNSILNGDKKNVLGVKNSFFNKLNGLNKNSNLPPVRANFAAHDVVKSIRFMSQNDMKELTLKVVPRNLGEIAIKLTVEAGVMKAVITAANKDTANLLQNNSMLIQEKLADNGMKSENIEVSIAHEDTTFHKESNEEGNFREQFRGNNSKSHDGEVEVDEENEDVALEYAINAMV